ncbi:Synaptic vesicle glycoprotein 2B [Trichoplax sp. H2]|nr:Synaptic vesicle glycoprotein 2B [Trichoplax sp. H2]|eukprot:RDD36496.1 Synaptic vesicle glycoprotein 2B [Trichoplax sp. H2]
MAKTEKTSILLKDKNLEDVATKDSAPLLSESKNLSDLEQSEEEIYQTVTIDYIMNKQRFGFFHCLIIIVCGLCYSGHAIFYQAIGFITITASDLVINADNHFWLSFSFTIGIIFGSGLLGSLGDVFGRRRIILASLAINLITTLVSVFAYNYTMLVVLTAINGLGFSGIISNVHSYAIEFLSRDYRGWALACVTSISILGSIFSTVLAALTLNYRFHVPVGQIYFTSWRLYLILCSLPILAGFCSLLFMPNSLRHTLRKGNTEKIVQISEKITRINSFVKRGSRSDNYKYITLSHSYLAKTHINGTNLTQEYQITHKLCDHRRKFKETPWHKRAWLLLIVWFGYSFTAHGLLMWLPSLLTYYVNGNTCRSVNHASKNLPWNRNYMIIFNGSEYLDNRDSKLSSALTHIMLSNILSIPLTLSCILLVGRNGRKGLFCTISIGCGIIVLLIWLIDSSMSAMILVCFFVAFSMNGWIPFTVWTTELFPTEIRSTALGIFNAIGHIGTLCGTIVFPLLFYIDCTASLLLYCIALLVAGIVAIYIQDTVNVDIG